MIQTEMKVINLFVHFPDKESFYLCIDLEPVNKSRLRKVADFVRKTYSMWALCSISWIFSRISLSCKINKLMSVYYKVLFSSLMNYKSLVATQARWCLVMQKNFLHLILFFAVLRSKNLLKYVHLISQK